MLPTLVLHRLTHAGRTWTAVPRLCLPVQATAAGYMVADPSIALVAQAATIEALEDDIALRVSLLWDGVVLFEDWETMPPSEIELMGALLTRFDVIGRPHRPVERAGYDPACRDERRGGCLGGNGCGCSSWRLT